MTSLLPSLYAVLAAMALPPASPLLVAAAGLLLAARGRQRAGTALAALGVLALAVLSLPAVSMALRAPLELRHPPTPIETLPEADVILVLGGGVEPVVSPRLDPDLGEAADRVLYAARLHRAGKAPLLLVSGGTPRGLDTSQSEADAMAWALRGWGVPPEAILRESGSHSTGENCRRSAELLRDRGAGRVLLVTSAIHMPRALATCRSAGIRAVPATTDVGVVSHSLRILDWIPRPSGLAGSEAALRERLGWLVYRLQGWIVPQGQRSPRSFHDG